MRNKFPLILSGFLLCLLASSCANLYDPESSQDYHTEVIATVNDNQEFTQGIVSDHSGISSLDIWLQAEPDSTNSNGSVQVEVFQENQGFPLFSAAYSVDHLTKETPLRINLPFPIGYADGTYTLAVTASRASVQLYGRNANVYSFGEASLAGAPLDADLGFYIYDFYGIASFINDLKFLLDHGWVALAAIILLIIPGWFILDVAGISADHDFGEQVGFSIAISVSLVGTLMAWTTLLGLRWSKSAVLIAAALVTLIAFWRVYRRGVIKFRFNSSPGLWWVQFGLVGIFTLTLLSRLVMVRNLAVPPWVDSIHHGLITRLIIEQGGYPKSYEPNLFASGYHTGFHSLVATYHWLTGLNIPLAMLLLGQILNALIIFAVYMFSNVFIASKMAGLFAAFAAGLLSPMPAYYTSWGRYPQLVGLLILPAALMIFIKLYETKPTATATKQPRLRIAFLSSLLLSGLLITHYRVAAFFVGLLLIDFIILKLKLRKDGFIPPHWRNNSSNIFLTLAVTVTLTLPWLPQVLTSLIFPRFKVGKSAPLFSGFQASYLTSAYGLQLLVIAGVGLLLAILRKKSFALKLLLWVILLFFLANLSYFHLPGGGYINNNSVGITLFLPISILFGYLMSEIIQIIKFVLPVYLKNLLYPTVIIFMLIVASLSISKFATLLNPTTFLARQPDLQAMAWIDQNIPSGSTILINPFLWGYNLYAGSDGGYWISALTDCETIPPPVLYGMDNDRLRIIKINELIKSTIDASQDLNTLAQLLKSEGIRYVYLGARGGIFSPTALESSLNFQTIYNHRGVWIFRVR